MAKAKRLPSGNWRTLVYVGKDENGKRKYKSVTAATKKEAEFLAAEYALEGNRRKNGKLTFEEALDSYIKAKDKVLAPSTVYTYRKMQRKNFSYLNGLLIDDITPDTIQSFINTISETLAPKSVRNIHGLISAVLRINRPEFSPMTTLPQKNKKEVYIPSKDDIKKIYAQIKGGDMELPFLLASQLGLRASEISGLLKSNVYSDKLIIKICQSRVDGENGPVIKNPKSYAGFRELPCSKYICDLALKNNSSEFVTGLSSINISHRWGRLIKKIEVFPFNFHALRHYFASRALLMGIPQKYIAELMGHSSTKMIEQIYQHTFPDAKKEYAELMVSESKDIVCKKCNAECNT